MPSVMCGLGARHALDGTHSRRRPVGAPGRAERRVIFPSLHADHGARPSPDPRPEPNSGRDQPFRPNNNLAAKGGGKSSQLRRSFTNVDATTLGITPDPGPTLTRATSLDGISIPLPRLSLTEDSKPDEELSLPLQRPISELSIQSAPPFEKKSHFLGDTARHGTYYPATSSPAPVHGKKYLPHSRSLTSVLRRGKRPLLPSGSQKMPNPNEVESQAHSRRSLHSLRSDNSEAKDCIGESDSDLQRLADFHKIPPCKECKHECLEDKKPLMFNPRVIVFEFVVSNYETKGGGKWWTEDELEQFKQGALNRIALRDTRIIPTGTGRFLTVAPKIGRQPKEPFSFNHPALGCDDEFDPGSPRRSLTRKGPTKDALLLEKHAVTEIKSILVVDPHKILLNLFTKSLKHMIPHASVATAQSAEGAMMRIEAAQKAFSLSAGGATHGFDILIIEENLRSSPSAQRTGEDSTQHGGGMDSGSALIRYIDESQNDLRMSEGRGGSIRCSLLVGVSARLAVDRDKLEKSGADCVWGKPPPEMNAGLRNKLLRLLMKKRNRAG